MIKIALVDDHVLVRTALANWISAQHGFSITLQADHGIDLFEQLDENALPDIVLLDIHMPLMDGVETAIRLRNRFPCVKVMVFTMIKNGHVHQRMLRSGVRAFICKDCDTSELLNAFREVHENGYYFNEYLTVTTLQQRSGFYDMSLNEQQRIFLRLAAAGLTHREIAERMQVSPRTVDSYRDILFKKLDVNSRVGLVIYAIRNGFITP